MRFYYVRRSVLSKIHTANIEASLVMENPKEFSNANSSFLKALRSLKASSHVANLFLYLMHMYGELLSSSTAISNTAVILWLHLCSIPITLKKCTLAYSTQSANRGRSRSSKS